MEPLKWYEFAGLNFNELCVFTIAFAALFLIGLLIMDGLGHIWMRITGREK